MSPPSEVSGASRAQPARSVHVCALRWGNISGRTAHAGATCSVSKNSENIQQGAPPSGLFSQVQMYSQQSFLLIPMLPVQLSLPGKYDRRTFTLDLM